MLVTEEWWRSKVTSISNLLPTKTVSSIRHQYRDISTQDLNPMKIVDKLSARLSVRRKHALLPQLSWKTFLLWNSRAADSDKLAFCKEIYCHVQGLFWLRSDFLHFFVWGKFFVSHFLCQRARPLFPCLPKSPLFAALLNPIRKRKNTKLIRIFIKKWLVYYWFFLKRVRNCENSAFL